MATLSNRYGEACYPNTYRVCGYTLRPFSLGHALLFDRVLHDRLDSALAGGTRAPGVGDLRLAVAICRRTHGQAVRFLQSGWATWIIRAMLRINFLTVAKGVVQFAAYRTAHGDHPDIWKDPENKGRPAQSPVFQQVKLTLIGRLGYPVEAALDVPLAQAMFDYFGYWEMEGQMKLVGDADTELARDLKDTTSELSKEMAKFQEEMKKREKVLKHA